MPAYFASASSDLKLLISPSSEIIEVAKTVEIPGIDLRILISFSKEEPLISLEISFSIREMVSSYHLILYSILHIIHIYYVYILLQLHLFLHHLRYLFG